MFMGICPGNVGSMNYLDAYRRESQRDFADGGGVTSRALIEGLFGVKPDALAGELQIRPGFPASWDHASLRHPNVDFSFQRDGRHRPLCGRIQIREADGAPLRTARAARDVWRA